MSLLRLFRAQPRIWPQRRPCLYRGMRLSPSLLSDLSPEPPSLEEVEHEAELAAQEEELAEAMEAEAESAPSAEDQSAAPAETSYRLFMRDTAPAYKFASPRNWLGGSVPFPLNKSFCPPPPISDKRRNEIYRLYMLDPEKNSVRALSQRFHISLARVDAILRLKGMEADWVKKNSVTPLHRPETG
ncbi:eukaryotic mitochondrial regulator protein-domain-containing protein, partial [Lentinula raphanica]